MIELELIEAKGGSQPKVAMVSNIKSRIQPTETVSFFARLPCSGGFDVGLFLAASDKGR
jgi:hypothetical protein